MSTTTATEFTTDELGALWLRLATAYGADNGMATLGASPATLRAATQAASTLCRYHHCTYTWKDGVQGAFWNDADGTRNEERVTLAAAIRATNAFHY